MSISVLDVCCSNRGFWFDKSDNRAVFLDKRNETIRYERTDRPEHGRVIDIKPTVQADFTALPFPDKTFQMVVYDPPHLKTLGVNSWCAKKYGRLQGDWEFELQTGFFECFRVLKPGGALIFKWNSTEVTISHVLRLINVKPLFGHKSGKHSKTHWVAFIK